MENSIITLNSKAPAFKNKSLNESTAIIYSAANAYNKTATETRKVIAKALAVVEAGKLYKDDGLKSLAEYAERIGLDKSLAHKLENAGRLLRSKDETIRKFAETADYSKLAIMSSADADEVKKAIESGTIKPESTAAEVKEWKAAINTKKASSNPALVPDYKVTYNHYGPSYQGDTRTVDRIALQNPKDFPEANGTPPLAVFKANDTDLATVYVALYNDRSVMVYTVERIAKEAKKPKASKPDFSTLDKAAFKEMLKAAMAKGISLDELMDK